MSPRYANLPARDALVLEWLGDGNALDTNDGTKATLTSTNVSYASCPVGYQKQWGVFNGSSSKVTSDYSTSNSSYSVVGSFKCAVSDTNNKTLFCKGANGSGRAFWGLIGRNNHPTFPSKLAVLFASDVTIYSSTSFDDNKPHQFVLTATSGAVYLYVDNKLEASATSPFSVDNSTTPALRFGASTNDDSWFNGNLNCRLFNRIITETERLAYFHEFNRQLGGGSDFGAFIPAPTLDLDFNDLNDIAGQVATAEVGSISSGSDKFGITKKCVFSGDGVSLGTYSNPTGAFTIVSLFKTSSSSVQSIYDATDGAYAAYFYTSIATANRLRFQTVISGSYGVVESTSNVCDGNYHVGIVTSSGATNGLKLYVDGNLEATQSDGNGSAMAALSGYCGIGYRRYNSTNNFNGNIERFMIIPSQLDANQVKALTNAINSGYPYPFRRSIPNGLLSKFLYYLPGYFSGTTDYDVISGRNFTMGNTPSQIRSMQSSGLTFNGTTQYSQNQSVSGVSTTNVISFGFLFKLTDSGTGKFLCEPRSGSTNGDRTAWVRSDSGTLHFGKANQGTGYLTDLTLSGTWNDSKWHSFVGVINGASYSAYVDGALMASTVSGDTSNFAAAKSIWGARLDNSNNPASHTEVSVVERFYCETALTQTEAQIFHYSSFNK